MARFRFRLQTLLHYREHLVEQAQQALAQLCAREQALLAEINHCKQKLEYFGVQGTAWTAHELQVHDAYRQRLTEELTMLQSKLAVLQLEREQMQYQLLERMSERDALEKMRQRHLEEHQRLLQRAEQHLLDDIAGRRSHHLGTISKQ